MSAPTTAHNPEVVGSSPSPATKLIPKNGSTPPFLGISFCPELNPKPVQFAFRPMFDPYGNFSSKKRGRFQAPSTAFPSNEKFFSFDILYSIAAYKSVHSAAALERSLPLAVFFVFAYQNLVVLILRKNAVLFYFSFVVADAHSRPYLESAEKRV